MKKFKFQNSLGSYYISVLGGCKIKVTFEPYDIAWVAKDFFSKFIKSYSGFLLKNKPSNFDFEIVIQSSSHAVVLTKTKRNKGLIEYYTRKNKFIYTHYKIGFLIFQFIIYDLLLEYLSKHKGVILHASSSLINDTAFLFLGPSGTGKSTLIKLLRSKFIALADDELAVIKNENKYYVYQLPFDGKENWYKRTNTKYILGKILFLTQSQNDYVESQQNIELITSRLLTQTLSGISNSKQSVSFIFNLIKKHREFYELGFSLNKKNVIKILGD